MWESIKISLIWFQIPYYNQLLRNSLDTFWFFVKAEYPQLFKMTVKITSFPTTLSVWGWVFLIYFSKNNI